MLIREIILKVNLFWDLCMQTIENIPKNPEHVDNVPKRPENPDSNVQKVYPPPPSPPPRENLKKMTKAIDVCPQRTRAD